MSLQSRVYMRSITIIVITEIPRRRPARCQVPGSGELPGPVPVGPLSQPRHASSKQKHNFAVHDAAFVLQPPPIGPHKSQRIYSREQDSTLEVSVVCYLTKVCVSPKQDRWLGDYGVM